MAQNKECSKCKQLKPLTEYHKMSKAPDGLQYRCKTCMSKEGKRFRKDRPEYYTHTHPEGYYYRNPLQKEHHRQLSEKQRQGDKSVVYAIRLEDDTLYVGATSQSITYRMIYHRSNYKTYLKGRRKQIPLLYDYLDQFPLETALDKLQNYLILEEWDGRASNKELNERESKWIEKLEGLHFNLLNKNHTECVS